MTTRTYTGWAIDTRSAEGHGFLGVGYFAWPDGPLPVVRTWLFSAREEARRVLRELKRRPYQAFPRACVVRVRVTVDGVEG